MKKVEVKIECSESKIYATFYDGSVFILSDRDSDYLFVDLTASGNYLAQSAFSLEKALNDVINKGYNIYEFDTEKEFLEQAYKWVVGESIEPTKAQEVIVDDSKIVVDKKMLYKVLQKADLCPDLVRLNVKNCDISSCLNCRKLAVGLDVQE